MRVSVIIPAEKKNENLEKCLKALSKQTFRDFEIITVLDKFSGKPAEKRNWGAKKAKGEILAFLDDDCIADKDWIKNGIKAFREDISAIGGQMKTPPNSPFWERVSGCLWESPLINPIKAKKFVDDWPSANFFIRKKDFLKLGGFDGRFWPGEDTKLCLDIARRGGKILYDPEVVVYHRRRPLFMPFLKQVARYGRQRGRFARMFPETSRKWQYFAPSVFLGYLGIVGILNGRVTTRPYIILPLVIYLVLVFGGGARAAIKEKNILMGMVFMIGVILTHMVYGVNFLRGLVL